MFLIWYMHSSKTRTTSHLSEATKWPAGKLISKQIKRKKEAFNKTVHLVHAQLKNLNISPSKNYKFS